jgi:uncharacterized protein (TIGR02453 family)
MAKQPAFDGFHPQMIQFLDELASHNNRDWFAKNKPRYESDVLEPSLEFIEAMQKPLSAVSPHFVAVPKRVGGSLMRVYRDTRFAKDKTPYKTNVGIHFRHEKGKDVHAPGFYVHISPEECFVGCGIWHPDSKGLAKIRKTIHKDQAGWKRAAMGKAFLSKFKMLGDSLKRPPKGYDAEHPLIAELKRKDFIASSDLDYDELFDKSVIKNVSARMKKAVPMMKFLCGALRLKF